MATHVQVPGERRKHDPGVEERNKTGAPKPVPHGTFRSVGLGLITGRLTTIPPQSEPMLRLAPRLGLRSYGPPPLPSP